jgi:methylthioxylose transferase
VNPPSNEAAAPSSPSDRAGECPRLAEPPNRLRIAILLLIALATLLVSALVWTQAWHIGIAREWQWPYFPPPESFVAIVPAVFFCALMAVLVAVSLRRGLATKRSEIITVGLGAALSLGIILETAQAVPTSPYDAYNAIVAPWAGGYYAEAVHVSDMGAYLKGYAGMVPQLRVDDHMRGHIADHPAGPVVFHWAVNRILDRWPAAARWFTPSSANEVVNLGSQGKPTTWRRIAMELARGSLSDGEFAGIWASALLFRLGYWLALILVYLLVRDICSRETALLALALSALIPSLHLFSPYPDLLFPLFAVAGLYAWHRALRRGGVGWAALSGAIAVAGLLWSMSLLAGVALLGAYSLLVAWRGVVEGRGGSGRGAWLRATFGWCAGFLICSLLPMLLFGYDVWSVWRTCLSQHSTFAAHFPRSYWAWTLFNPVEFAVFAGLPAFLLLMVTAVTDFRRWCPERRRQALSSLPWALLVVLAALDFSGKNLGEVARLWMFLMPFAAAAGACALASLDGKRGWIAGAVLALAAAQLVVFRLSLNVFGLEI